MTSDFPYYLALFGLTFFLTVICCCVKLIDIIDRPTPRANNMPSWNYANYLQNSPVAILNPHPDPFLRYSMLGENQGGLSGEEYLTATTTHTTQPGLYPSTSRSAIFSQAQQIRAAAAAAAAAAAPASAAMTAGTSSSVGSGGSNNDDSPASSSITGGIFPQHHGGSIRSQNHPLHHHHQSPTSGVPPPPGPPASTTPVISRNPILYSIHVPEERTRCVRHSGGGGGGELPPKYEDVCFDV